VVTAASGADAFARVTADRPDPVLLDVVMPGMSGYEVCQLILADGGGKGIPPVVRTEPAVKRRDNIGLQLPAAPCGPSVGRRRVRTRRSVTESTLAQFAIPVRLPTEPRGPRHFGTRL
jgi:putative two-component system response regulator